MTYETRRKLQELVDEEKANLPFLLHGDICWPTRYGRKPHVDLSEDVVERMEKSVDLLDSYLDKGYCVYGVNTGYGGSADTRTVNYADLQLAPMEHTQSAVITSFDKGDDSAAHLDVGSCAVVSSWVNGAMLVHENQIIRGTPLPATWHHRRAISNIP